MPVDCQQNEYSRVTKQQIVQLSEDFWTQTRKNSHMELNAIQGFWFVYLSPYGVPYFRPFLFPLPIPPCPTLKQHVKQRITLLLNTVISNYIFQPLAQLVICLKMHRISSKQECGSNCHYMLTKELGHTPSLRRQVELRLDQWVSEQLLEYEVAPEIKAGWCEGHGSPLGTT